MLSEILGELDDTGSCNTIKPKPMLSSYSFTSRKLAAKSYMKNFSQPIKKTPRMLNSVLKEVQNSVTLKEDTNESSPHFEENETPPTLETADIKETKIQEEAATQMSEDLVIETDLTQECFEDDFDMTQIEEFESHEVQDTTIDEAEFTDGLQSEFMSEWENFTNEANTLENDTLLDKTDISLLEVDDKKVDWYLVGHLDFD